MIRSFNTSKTVPTDSEGFVLTVEQGKKYHEPEVGAKWTRTIVDDRQKNVQESQKDGKRQLEVDREMADWT